MEAQLLALKRRRVEMFFKMPSISIRIAALIGSLVLVLPISVILGGTEGHTMIVSMMTHSCFSGQAQGESKHTSKVPARNCPVLELRAALALLSLKPALKLHIKEPIGIDAPGTEQFPPILLYVEIRNNPPTLEPQLSVLGVLRI